MVWAACVPRDWPQSVAVEDAAGAVHELAVRGPYCFYEDTDGRTKLGVAAEWVRQLPAGLHLVRFADGAELAVRLDSPYQWERAGVAA
jgi:hypothetical protein